MNMAVRILEWPTEAADAFPLALWDASSIALATGGTEGVIYRLPRVEQPTEADLEEVHSYPAGEAPDGIAFGENGKLYVALADGQLTVLDIAGQMQSWRQRRAVW